MDNANGFYPLDWGFKSLPLYYAEQGHSLTGKTLGFEPSDVKVRLLLPLYGSDALLD